MVPYRLVRSKRRTLAIHLTPSGEVEVRAPLRLSKEIIEGFLAQKQAWLAEKTAHLAALAESRAAFSRLGPAVLPLLGRDYLVREGGGRGATFDGEAFLLPKGEGFPLGAVEALYRRLAASTLRPLVDRWAGQMGLCPTAVRITGATTRWGSCSGKNSLNFSWRLMLAPLPAVEYVVVHELAHIREHNHSLQFWALVGEMLPDYPAQKALLRKVQERLAREGWDRAG